MIEEVVIGVAGGRAKRRKLAQALAGRPAILADGRSAGAARRRGPAGRAAEGGCGEISPPACAGCGKHLRSLQRRGEDWYCAVCGPKREPCAGCGRARVIHLRDRDGSPAARKCPPDAGTRWPSCTGSRRGIDPRCPPARSRGGDAVPRPASAISSPGPLQDQPELLTGEGPRHRYRRCCGSSTGSARRAPRTSSGRPAPTAAGCPPVNPATGRWLCRNCVAKSRAEPCSALRGPPRGSHPRQGRPAAVPALPDHRPGQPGDLRRLRPPAPGQRPHSRRPAVPVCRPVKIAACGICGHHAPCYLSDHRRAVVRGLQAALGPLLAVRTARPGPRRHQGRAALRDLHPFRPRVLAQLPGLRPARPDQHRPVRPLRHQPAAA